MSEIQVKCAASLVDAFMLSMEHVVKRRHDAISAQIAVVDWQIKALQDRATASDHRGIAVALPPKVRLEAPVAVSSVKPAISGLGVTASGDHRLGRF